MAAPGDIMNADQAGLMIQGRFTAFLKDFERPLPPSSQSEPPPSSQRAQSGFKVRSGALTGSSLARALRSRRVTPPSARHRLTAST